MSLKTGDPTHTINQKSRNLMYLKYMKQRMHFKTKIEITMFLKWWSQSTSSNLQQKRFWKRERKKCLSRIFLFQGVYFMQCHLQLNIKLVSCNKS
jgi:hypothetical protein